MPSGFMRRAAKKMGLRNLYEFVGKFATPYRGVYTSWEEARRAIPKRRMIGYDHAETVRLEADFIDTLRMSDYAAMFWMKPAISQSSSVFDLGGNIGMACYAFEKYLNYPVHLRWIVCDVPEVIRFGRELARQRKMTRLVFTDNFQDADGTDILLTAGTLQCMESSLSAILLRLNKKPEHLIINRTPLYDGESYFTTRELPPTILIYRVFNRKEFIGSIETLGYQLVDTWEIAEPTSGSVIIPFHPERTIKTYSGLYFKSIHR
jgi:putative methyltransferase (TIGR04325 family)